MHSRRQLENCLEISFNRKLSQLDPRSFQVRHCWKWNGQKLRRQYRWIFKTWRNWRTCSLSWNCYLPKSCCHNGKLRNFPIRFEASNCSSIIIWKRKLVNRWVGNFGKSKRLLTFSNSDTSVTVLIHPEYLNNERRRANIAIIKVKTLKLKFESNFNFVFSDKFHFRSAENYTATSRIAYTKFYWRKLLSSCDILQCLD